MTKRGPIVGLGSVLCLFMLAGCGGGDRPEERPAEGGLSGRVTGDGSSTVFPIMEAIAEEFQKENPDVRVTVGISGTGGGFKKFCNGETDFADASRPISESEVEACRQTGVEYVEIPVAFDGLSVVVNPANEFVECMKVAELKRLWGPAAQGTVTRWSQVWKGWPNEEVHLYGPGTDSGTYDYFTAAIVGEEGASRGDFTSSEDDNVIVQGVVGDPQGLGYFGYAYYQENKDRLKLVEVDGGQGCVAPSAQTISEGTYQPLSRPLFVYFRTTSLERPEVKAFADYTVSNSVGLVSEAGYIPLPDEVYLLARERIARGITGSIYEGGGSQVGTRLQDLLRAENASVERSPAGETSDTAAP